MKFWSRSSIDKELLAPVSDSTQLREDSGLFSSRGVSGGSGTLEALANASAADCTPTAQSQRQPMLLLELLRSR